MKSNFLTVLDLDHSQLKQLCDDAITKIDQLTSSISNAGVSSKEYEQLRSDTRIAVVAAGTYHAKLAYAQVSSMFAVISHYLLIILLRIFINNVTT